MSETNIPKPRCDDCGEVIDMEEGHVLSSVDLPYFIAENFEETMVDRAQRDPPDWCRDEEGWNEDAWNYCWYVLEFKANDGKFMFHGDCDGHWYHELLVVDEDIDFDDMDAEQPDDLHCDECGMRHIDRDDLERCGQCGMELNKDD